MSKQMMALCSATSFLIAFGIDVFLRAELTFRISSVVVTLLSDVRVVCVIAAGVLLACAVIGQPVPAQESANRPLSGRTSLVLGLGLIAVSITLSLIGQLIVLDAEESSQQAWPGLLLSLMLYAMEITGSMLVALGTISLLSRGHAEAPSDE